MPQMNKGGKFIFGISRIREGGLVRFPPQAVREYEITRDGRVILFTGSRSTGGFCVTCPGLLGSSKLPHILADNRGLTDGTLPAGEFVRYKGRGHCWCGVSESGTIFLTAPMQAYLGLQCGDDLLSIRSSDIAFTMGAKGPLIEKSIHYEGTIERF